MDGGVGRNGWVLWWFSVVWDLFCDETLARLPSPIARHGEAPASVRGASLGFGGPRLGVRKHASRAPR